MFYIYHLNSPDTVTLTQCIVGCRSIAFKKQLKLVKLYEKYQELYLLLNNNRNGLEISVIVQTTIVLNELWDLFKNNLVKKTFTIHINSFNNALSYYNHKPILTEHVKSNHILVIKSLHIFSMYSEPYAISSTMSKTGSLFWTSLLAPS